MAKTFYHWNSGDAYPPVMDVGELKAKLANIPDDVVVRVEYDYGCCRSLFDGSFGLTRVTPREDDKHNDPYDMLVINIDYSPGGR